MERHAPHRRGQPAPRLSTRRSSPKSSGELQLEVVGIDDTSLQPVHARHTWFAGSIAWGARLADVLSETPDGDMVLDLRNFHEVVPCG